MLLCDTNIIIEIFKNNPKIREECIRFGIENLAVSAITVGELFHGAFDQTELEKIKKHLKHYRLLGISEIITNKYLELMSQYSLSHRCYADDMLIAATAIHHNIQLYTLNTKDFVFIKEIKLYK